MLQSESQGSAAGQRGGRPDSAAETVKGETQLSYLKNISHERVVKLADEIDAASGQVVSKTLAQNEAVRLASRRSLFPKGRRSAPTLRTGTPWCLSSQGCAESDH